MKPSYPLDHRLNVDFKRVVGAKGSWVHSDVPVRTPTMNSPDLLCVPAYVVFGDVENMTIKTLLCLF